MTTGRNRARRNYNANSSYQPMQASEATEGLAAKNNSRNLLVAQLKAGQHNLLNDAFWAIVGELKTEGAI